ncbi:PTS fructose transporter subunit IIC [Enterococcus pallens]|uniref:PTS system, Fru family, IIC component n=1 Tax=Enterococcus pallens ATCC BAA-351 TaxID=1158607 RepID=R2SNK6_9ENTE|nr:PTS fructose transporter subunit IIC [Enterococcus pallens]EOH94411.1 PTS system, Fru family, IIC component [Enterococcus pallens ATCC BAA-351]EOU24290.1 PTS system fructose-specific transporter subunit IIBC [Enterococcus pallens ATCC BAA-351]OJG81929.1 PTS system, Fru family, IIC component [Enterococcus pallens]
MEKIKAIGFKKHLMTAISFFLPIIVASGFLLAIGNMMGGASIDNFREGFSFADTMTTMGGYGLGFLPMIVSTAIAYSIADKPGIAPGLIVGFVAHGIGTGFLGGVVSGYISGYVVVIMMMIIKVPKWMEGLMPTLVLPFLSAFVAGMVMYYVVGTPITWFTDLITGYLGNLNTSSLFVYGAIIGILASIDYGGAINKVVFAFVFALFSEGIYEPITVLILASMVTPFGLTIAYFIGKVINKNIFNRQEIETLKTAFPMGICQITEGCFPIVLNDLVRNVIATGVGGAIGGGLSMLWGADSHIPASGMFAIPTMTRPWAFIAALAIGSLATAVTILILKKRVDPNAEVVMEEKEEDDVSWDDLTIS